MSLRWHGAEVEAAVRAQMIRNLRAAAIIVRNAARENVRPGGPSGFRTSSGGRGLLGRIGIAVDESKMIAKVGCNLDGAQTNTDVVYARIHELGGVITPKRAKALHFVIDGKHYTSQRVVIPPRPYLRPALDNNRVNIKRALATPLKQ